MSVMLNCSCDVDIYCLLEESFSFSAKDVIESLEMDVVCKLIFCNVSIAFSHEFCGLLYFLVPICSYLNLHSASKTLIVENVQLCTPSVW